VAKSKAWHSLTPGEKREEEKRKAKLEVEKLKRSATKLKADLVKVEKATSEKPGPKGRVVAPETLESIDTTPEDLADERVLFKPNPGPQTTFLAAPETDVLYGGAAGGGKSFAMVVDCLRYAHRKKHRALILRKSMPELVELIDNTRELYPSAFPGAVYKETTKTWTFPSGAKIEFAFLEKDSDVFRYQGQAFTWIGFDEITHLATEFPWTYLQSRLRTTDPEITCYLRCTANPGGIGHSWVKRRYVEPVEPGTPFVVKKISRRFIPAKLEDNPYLTRDDNYLTMLEALPEVTRRRLLQGDWDVNEGSAFPEFEKVVHTIEPFVIPADWNRFKACDYGYSAPSCCLWGAVHPETGTVFIYRELYESGLTAVDLRERLTEMERDEHRSIPGVLDGACWNRTGYSGPTIGETLCQGVWGHKFRPADKNRKAGKVQVHEYLKHGEHGPQLIIFNTCTNLIREITNIPMKKTDNEDVDTNAEDHAYDALRYLLMSRPRKTPMSVMAMEFKREARFTPADTGFGY
jgi:hypothetical protein